MEGQVLTFRSPLYGDRQPFALCVTDLAPEPKPLLIDLIPGTLGNLERAARDCEQTCRIAAENGLRCIAIRPCGRGNGSVYEGYGEVDVLEVIDAVRQLAAVDSNRISVTGASMGGAATWYLASHYPDLFAAAAPFCGYCDYKLWDKPGGTTFPRKQWEEFSWISRDAAYRPANLRPLALRITHGEWDRAVGGGVSVEHSREMDAELTRLHIPHTYVEAPKTGHNCRTPALWQETVLWLLRQERHLNPDHLSLVVHTLRHNRSFWVAVEQQTVSGEPSTVEAQWDRAPAQVNVTTTNVNRLALGPIAGANSVCIELDQVAFPAVDLSWMQCFARTPSGGWERTDAAIPAGQKRPGLSGPFGDLFIRPTVIVYGTAGSGAETEFNRLAAFNAAQFFRQWNGGVHRGGIPGDNAVLIPALSDQEMQAVLQTGSLPEPRDDLRDLTIDRDLLERANLFFIGNFTSNAELAKLAGALPIRIGKKTVRMGGKTFHGDHLAFYALFPHPDGKRYVALLAGIESDAICWGSHVGLQLLPDYLVFDHPRVVDWGWWGNEWQWGK